MNFFGVGPAELIVILVVALVFVGPDRLPRLAADLARTIREIRKYTGSLAAEFNEVIQDFERETETDRSQWKEIGQGLTGATQSVTDAIRGARADAAGSPPVTPAPPEAAGSAKPQPIGSSAEPGATDGGWRDIAEPIATTANRGDEAGPQAHESDSALDEPPIPPPPDAAHTGTNGAGPLNGAAQTAATAPEEQR